MSIRVPFRLAALGAAVITAASAGAAPSTWVYYRSDGRLAYRTWGSGNRILDFSTAGYRGGGVALPTVPTVRTLSPSGGDDRSALQNAIDAVAALPLQNGLRGAVQLSAGTFRVSGQINVTASGVVIRGAGSSNTTLQVTAGSPITLFNIMGSSSRSETGAVNLTDSYVPSGATSFNVSSTTGYAVGQNVMIRRPVTQAWIDYVGMGDLVRDGEPQTWLSAGSTITTDRTIRAISGNRITLDAPVTDSFDSRYLGNPVGTMVRYSWAGRLTQVGLENVRIQMPAVQTSYRSIVMDNIMDAWVRNVVIQDGVNCVTVAKNARRVTFDNVRIEHTVPSTSAAGPSDFATTGTQILFNKCSTYGTGSWPFATHSTGTGPVVVLNFFTEQRAGISPHMRWTTGLLADNCRLPNAPQGTQGIAYRNRGSMGSGHGWTTAWSVAWNVTTPYFLVSAAAGTQSWCIGCVGTRTSTADPDGIYESLGARVDLGATDSLYLEQLRDRLGDQALANIGYGGGTPVPTPTPTPTAGPTPTPCSGCGFSGYYRLMARHSGKAVVVQSASTADGADVIQWTYGGATTNDEWELRNLGTGYYRIINRNSGKDLTVQSASTAEGADIFQWPYGGANTNDEWAVVDVGGGYFRITNRLSGKSAEVLGGTTSDGADVVQRTYGAAAHQQFQLLSVP